MAASSSLSLYTYEGDFRALKAFIAARYNGIEIATPEFKVGEDTETPEFRAKSPLGKVPVLDTPEGSLFESSAIARYVARMRRDTNLCGRSFFESGEVDAWVDFCSLQVEVPASLIVFPIFGYSAFKKQTDVQAWADLTAALEAMERHLLYRTFFVGESITLADISLASALLFPMTLVLDAEAREAFPNVTRWFLTCVNQPEFAAEMGEVVLCAERKFPAGVTPAAAGGKKGGKGDKKAGKGDKKAGKGDKKAGKKAAKGGASSAAAAPAKKPAKEKKWWEELPPSSMNLDDFKRLYSNAPSNESGDRDYYAIMPEFWQGKYDPEGFSIWFADYNHNEENKVAFMVSNLVGGFVQRCDAIRKHAFGNMLILGDAAPFQVTGCWIIRGQSIKPMLDANPDAEYYTWTKMDSTNEEQRKRVADMWCCYDTCGGVTVQDARMFK